MYLDLPESKNSWISIVCFNSRRWVVATTTLKITACLHNKTNVSILCFQKISGTEAVSFGFE